MADTYVYNEWRMSKVETPVPQDLLLRQIELEADIQETQAQIADLVDHLTNLLDAKESLDFHISVARHLIYKDNQGPDTWK